MTKEVKPKKKAERGDKIRNRAKIIKEIIKDPTQSQRDIAKKIGIGKSTVAEHMQDLPNTDKVGHIAKVIENDATIVTLGQKILIQRLGLAQEDPKAVSTRDVISATDLSGKRHMLLQGNVTDDKGGLINNLKELSDDELLSKII